MIVVGLFLTAIALFFAALFISTKHTMDYVFCNSTVSAWEARLLPTSKFMELIETPDLRSALLALEGTEYGGVVREFSDKDDFRVLERLLHGLVVQRLSALVSLVPDDTAPAVRKIIAQRYLWNLKMIVSAIHYQIPKEERSRELLPSPVHTYESLQLLASAESLEQLLEFLKGTDYGDSLQRALSDYEQHGLPALLVALEKTYYSSLWELAQKTKTDRKILKQLVGYLVDAVNAKTILRLKDAGVPEPEIDKYLIRPSHELTEPMLKAMMVAEDIKSAIHSIRITMVGSALSSAAEEIAREGPEAAERALDRFYLELCKRLSLLHQFSVAPVISYVAHKEAEFRNLRKCLRMKADGLPAAEIKKRLVLEVSLS